MSAPLFKIAVLSDTHIPDRSPGFPPGFLAQLQAEKPDLILHAGDISLARVLDDLMGIAPVKAVRGNRDFLLAKRIPMVQCFEVRGVRFALMHGQINFFTYWWDKVMYVIKGYDCERYINRLPGVVPDADVYIFGHTHHAEDVCVKGKRFFNPGSISYGDVLTRERSWGILEIAEGGCVSGRIIHLGN